MKLPYQNSNSQKGQILIIFLLVLVVGLAIALSIASRTVTDVRQTTTSDESNRAYFAAEAGVENALKKIEQGTLGTIGPTGVAADVDLKTTNRSEADVTVKNLGVANGENFQYPSPLQKDDVAQINLMSNFNNITTAGVYDTDGNGFTRSDPINIYWGEAGSQTAIEVSIITCTSPCTTGVGQVFNIYKMIFDPIGSGRIPNACTTVTSTLAAPVATNLTDNPPGVPFRWMRTLNFTTACASNDTIPAGQAPVLARIRALYGGTELAVASDRLPNQGYEVDSKGLVGSGVARKLLVYQLYPALPSVFDYVLYNGSASNPLTK